MTMYDAIVVGARCAGAPTAMLLARKGHRVLLCDRASFPSDTVSNGMFNTPGPTYLRRWGLLERLEATGCPPIWGGTWHAFGQTGSWQTPEPMYAPRRTVLDHLLVQAAVEAGVELRERFRVTGVVEEDGRVTGIRAISPDGREQVETARIVVGADGRRSTMARLFGAQERMRRRLTGGGVYAYFADVPVDGYERFAGAFGIGGLAGPSNDGLTHVATWGPQVHGSPEERFENALATYPSLRERVKAGRRATPFVAHRDSAVFERECCGLGWALVGDAGFHQSAVNGYGMSHAFREADGLARAVHGWLANECSYDEAMRRFEGGRDDLVLPFAEWIAACLDAWPRGEQGPSELPLVQRWLERIAEEDSVPV